MTKHPTAALSALAFSAFLLTACGGGGGGSGGGVLPVAGGTPTTPTPTAPAPAPTAPERPAAPDPSGDTLVSSVPTATYAASSEEAKAYDLLNAERQRCGFGLLAQNVKLDVAAQGHAKFLLANNFAGHFQDNTKPFFTGNTAGDRATNAGYSWATMLDDNNDTWGAGANVLTDRGLKAVRDLLSAPYHALSLLSPSLDIGVSVMSSDTAGSTGTHGPRAITQINLGLAQGSYAQKPSGAYVQNYPCQGTVGTKYQLTNETPNPIPGRDLAVNPVGQPVVVVVRPGQILNITSATMVKTSDSSAVALLPTITKANDANGMLNPGQAIVIPDLPLLPNTEYTVTLVGTNQTATFPGGIATSTGTNPAITDNATGAFTKTFSFTTGS